MESKPIALELKDNVTVLKKTSNVEKSKSKSNNYQVALVRKNDHETLPINLISQNKNKNATQQLFTLSLLEYICNLLNLKDKRSAEIQFKGKLINTD